MGRSYRWDFVYPMRFFGGFHIRGRLYEIDHRQRRLGAPRQNLLRVAVFHGLVVWTVPDDQTHD